jgi:hypothetical protein
MFKVPYLKMWLKKQNQKTNKQGKRKKATREKMVDC